VVLVMEMEKVRALDVDWAPHEDLDLVKDVGLGSAKDVEPGLVKDVGLEPLSDVVSDLGSVKILVLVSVLPVPWLHADEALEPAFEQDLES
jgi:hypothetical protein